MWDIAHILYIECIASYIVHLGRHFNLSHLPELLNKGGKISESIYMSVKNVQIVVPFEYLSLLYSKFEWAENPAVQARTINLSRKQICFMTKTYGLFAQN